MRRWLNDHLFTPMVGSTWSEWCAIQAQGGGIEPRYWPRSVLVGAVALLNSLQSNFSAPVDVKNLEPIFVLGHWRSGTTFLQKLLAALPGLATPTFVDVLAPWSTPLFRGALSALLRAVLSRHPELDEMPARPTDSGECDFALSAHGLSPYLAWSFPQAAAHFERYLDLKSLNEAEKAHWGQCYSRMVARWSVRHQKRLVLKSPPHTARLATLQSLFPNAKFVFIHRDPTRVFQSTCHMIRTQLNPLRFQSPVPNDIPSGVTRRAEIMFRNYFSERSMLAKHHLVEVAFSDLIGHPSDTVHRICRELQLPIAASEIRVRIETRTPSRRRNYADIPPQDFRRSMEPFCDAFGYSWAAARNAA
jgi:hypothetical protein